MYELASAGDTRVLNSVYCTRILDYGETITRAVWPRNRKWIYDDDAAATAAITSRISVGWVGEIVHVVEWSGINIIIIIIIAVSVK